MGRDEVEERCEELERELERVRKSEELMRLTLENISDAVFLTDDEGRFHYVCPNVDNIFGYQAAEVEAMGNLRTLLGVDVIDPAHLDREGELANVEITAPDKAGREHVLLVWLKRARVGEGTVVTVCRDITARRRVEETLRAKEEQLLHAQKMEAVGRLAGGVAHDFNNLLTAIFSFGGFALRRLHELDPVRDDVQQMLDAARRGEGLTRQLLAFSRKQTVIPRVIDPNRALEELSRLLGRLITEDIRIELELADRVWPVYIDPGAFEQAIINLAVNARDAMPTGGTLRIATSTVRLSEPESAAGAEVEPGAYVAIEVIDTGVGMDEHTRAHLFEPFFTTKGAGLGTGLGLSTCYGAITQARGYISVDSAPGEGATFRILLPRDDSGRHTQPLDAERATDPRGSERVLLAEDNEPVRAIARRLLERAGYQVTAAASGTEAMEAAGKPGAAFDLILTDVVMPGPSGSELIKQLTRLQPDARIVLMSGYTNDEIIRRGVLEHELAFLPKPFTPEQLLGRVREALDDET